MLLCCFVSPCHFLSDPPRPKNGRPEELKIEWVGLPFFARLSPRGGEQDESVRRKDPRSGLREGERSGGKEEEGELKVPPLFFVLLYNRSGLCLELFLPIYLIPYSDKSCLYFREVYSRYDLVYAKVLVRHFRLRQSLTCSANLWKTKKWNGESGPPPPPSSLLCVCSPFSPRARRKEERRGWAPPYLLPH